MRMTRNENKLHMEEKIRMNWTIMLVSPQSFRTGDFPLQHVTHSHPHGFMADALVVVLTVSWVALLKHTHSRASSNLECDLDQYIKISICIYTSKLCVLR